eukprot:3321434-Amphidinium_carterae.2
MLRSGMIDMHAYKLQQKDSERRQIVTLFHRVFSYTSNCKNEDSLCLFSDVTSARSDMSA